MAIESLIAPLLRVRLFQGLSGQQLADVARHAERVMFRPGEYLSVAGQSADAAVLIVAGPCERLLASQPGQSEPVETGSLIGEMAMFVDHIYGSSVVAVGNVRALRITRGGMHEQMLRDPLLSDFLVQKVAGRLNSVAQDLKRLDEMLARPFDSWGVPHDVAPDATLEALQPITAPDRLLPSYATH